MSVPEDDNGPCATRSEKAATLNTLTPEDFGKLLEFAKTTARKFSGRVNDADTEDLFHEAIVRVLDEDNRRNWYPKKVDFLIFVGGCIRSIASAWYKRAKNTESPDELVSPARHDEQTEAALMIAKIREALKDRPHAVAIFDLKCDGLKGKEIQERLGISDKIYTTAVRWIQRTVKGLQ